MKTKILLLFSAILLSMSLQAQNSITNLTGPSSVEANTTVSINFDYELAVEGHIYIRFKNGANTENNLTFVAQFNVPAGSGNLTASLEIPRTHEGEVLPVGAGYNYQAQIFDTGWSGLFTQDYNGVTLTAAQNYIELDNPPTTVNATSFVDVTFSYETNRTGGTHAFVRFQNASGTNLTSASKALSAASGTETLSIEIPDEALGSDYKFQVELFHPSTTWSAYFAVDTVEGITLAEAVAPANSIEWVGPPTSVEAGSDANITFNYVTDIANAHIFIRFKDDVNAEGLTNVNQIVTAGSGTLTLPLPIPSDALGSDYLYQAQIFDIDANYAHVITENFEGITVGPASANTVVINNPPNPVLISSSTEVTVGYTKDIVDDLFVILQFVDGAGNIEATEYGNATGSSGDIIFNLPIPATEAEDYSYNVQLLGLTGSVIYEKTYRGITASTELSTANFKNNFENLSIYPNPFNDSFTYKFDDQISSSTSVELFTMDGREIKTITNKDVTYGNTGTVNTSQLSSGLYLVRVTSGDLQSTRKLVKN
ncbi:T9SS type A sorting domain-containing protein [Algibacter sp. Ld11]|uniref:T9SS type A sorting domain-containing protein n=1 Tax=Algibacter sp. Ld11 TaxID=649150 RepID=UPI00386F9BE9